jgi:hypothetical protein
MTFEDRVYNIRSTSWTPVSDPFFMSASSFHNGVGLPCAGNRAPAASEIYASTPCCLRRLCFNNPFPNFKKSEGNPHRSSLGQMLTLNMAVFNGALPEEVLNTLDVFFKLCFSQ